MRVFKKHKRMTDVIVEVLAVLPNNEWHISYWNIAGSNPFCLGITEVIKPQNEEDWETVKLYNETVH